jgi:hypothetical protein
METRLNGGESGQGRDKLFIAVPGGVGRVACGDGVDSMLQFRLERGGDRIKRYQKMKRMQRSHLDSVGRKHDTV